MAVSLHCSTKESTVKINNVNISKLYIKDAALQTCYLIQKVHCAVYKKPGFQFVNIMYPGDSTGGKGGLSASLAVE